MSNSVVDPRSPLGLFSGQPKPRLYDCVVDALRSRHYSRRTEEAYIHWIRRFLAFHRGTHPRELAEKDLNLEISAVADDGQSPTVTLDINWNGGWSDDTENMKKSWSFRKFDMAHNQSLHPMLPRHLRVLDRTGELNPLDRVTLAPGGWICH